MNDPANARRKRRAAALAGRLLLLAFGCFVGLAIAELALRVARVSFPLPYQPDSHCGARLRPGFAAWFTKEGRAYVRINSAGMRDQEHSLHKPPGTVRIAVLGDSYAEAVQVPLEATFWSVLGRELERQQTFGAVRVEVLNFGVSGYGTGQELQMLRHYVWPYEPDIILLAFLAGNDVRNNSRRLEPDQVRPFFDLREGALVLDDSFRNHPTYLQANSHWTRGKVALINASRVLQLVHEWKNRRTTSERSPAPGGGTPAVAGVFAADPGGPWREAWRVTEEILCEIQRESHAHHARLFVALVTEDFQVHPDSSTRERLLREHGLDDPLVAERRIESLAQRAGFTVICLAEELGDYAAKNRAFLHGFANTRWGTGHWNELGHRVAGQAIARSIDAEMRSAARSKPVPAEAADGSGS
jgi:hypothetical protein